MLQCIVGCALKSSRKMPTNLLKAAVDQSVKSQNGHLDLFLRFLLGISLESNQSLLQGLLPKTENSSESLQKTSQHIKKMISNEETVFVIRLFRRRYIKTKKIQISTERAMNLLLCLLEMKDTSLHNEIDSYVKSGDKLSPAQCSALAYMILVSEDVLDEFDLKKYNTDDEGRERLIIAVRNSRKRFCTVLKMTYCFNRLIGYNFTEESFKNLSSALELSNSNLRELDLSYNHLQDSEVQMLCSALSSPDCKLEQMRSVSYSLWCKLVLQLSNSILYIFHFLVIAAEMRDLGVDS
uniref:NACHT LRR and PYD domain-containing protein n=1 Tax=Denticeps clupeoides TaxID=299321 RepID=A0AAY4BY97_9TELE